MSPDTFEGLGSLGKGDSDVDQKVLGHGHTPCTCSGWGQLASAGVLALLLFGTVARDPQCGWQVMGVNKHFCRIHL